MENQMLKKESVKRWVSFLLALIMTLEILIPSGVAFAEDNGMDVDITDFSISSVSESEPQDVFFSTAQFRINYAWNVQGAGKKPSNGSSFELNLPKEFDFSTELTEQNFVLKSSDDEVMANAVLNPDLNGGGKVRIIFTEFADGKDDLSGELALHAIWNEKIYPVKGEVSYEITAGDITKKVTLIEEVSEESQNVNDENDGTMQSDTAEEPAPSDNKEEVGSESISSNEEINLSDENKTETANDKKKEKSGIFSTNKENIADVNGFLKMTKNAEISQAPAKAPAFTTGDPMQNGKLVVYDDSHKIQDASNGSGASVNTYNLATMTDTLFTINYTPFYHVNDEGSNEYGDQKIVVDIPSYGFKLSNPGIEGPQFQKITLLDAKGKEIALDPVSQKNYDKVVKIIYDINDPFLGSLGGSSSMVFNIAFDRRSLTNAECDKWLNEGKLETNFNVAVCEGEKNEPINSAGSPSEYKWRMSPKNYDDPKTAIVGDRHLNSSAYGPIANMSLKDFYENNTASGPYTGNYDYYFYKHGTIHDGDTPLMKLKSIKLYVPKTAGAESNFYLNRFWGSVKNKYDNQIGHFFSISEIKNDGDGKGSYYILTPKNPIYNNGKDYQWTESFSNGFSPVWQVPDGVEDLGSDTLYSAETPEFVFEMPNGTDGSKEVVITEPNQGAKIQTLKSQVADTYSITGFNQPGFRLYKNGAGYKYTANAVSPDANYSDVAYTWLSNNHYTLKDSSGKWNEYIPKNKTGATVETYEFPKEIQPTAWTGRGAYWGEGRTKIDKVVYWTEDGQEHTAEVNDYAYLANGGNHFPRVEFDTTGGRVKKVEVHWEFINNKIFSATTYFAGQYTQANHHSSSGQSRFDYYVTPEATGLLKVTYKAVSVDPDADPNDNFTYEAEKAVNNPANDITGKAEDDFFWVTVVKKPCTPMVAFSTDERRKENNALIPNQAENGTFFDSWMLYFDYGKNKAYSPTPENPRADLLIGTMNLKGLNTQEQKTGLLTGKFIGTKALSGWKITYRTADNMTDVESADKIYNIGNIEDGTEINLGIDRSVEHLSKIRLSYDGIYNMEPFADPENGRVVLFSNIEYELRNTDFKGNPLEIDKERGMWYEPNWFLINLEGKYYNDNCSDKSHIHDSNRGQSFGGKAWNTNVYPHRYGVLTRTYRVTNKTGDNVISNTGDETINSISQSGTSMQKVTFNTKSYAFVMNSDMPEKGKMPWGIPDSAYVEITDKQFSADLDKCKFLGFDNASGNVEIKQIKDADGRVWIKMSLTDAGVAALNREIREITRNSASWSFYGGPSGALKALQDPMVIALKSFRYTSVTSPGENEHYPYGMVYYDMSKLESKLDGSKKEYYSYAKLEGDLFKLPENAANALGATKEEKLFAVDLSKVQVVVSKNTAVGSNVFPGKYDSIVYGTAGSRFPTQNFYPDEKDDLRGDFFVQAPDSDGFKQFVATIEIPKKNKSVTYTYQDATIQTPKTQFDMFLMGEAVVTGDSRPGRQEFSYSIDGGNTFSPADQIADWSKVTHVKLDLGELPKGSQVNITLPLKANGKTTTDELESYIGGSFVATDYTGYKMNGYVNPAKYIYGNFAIISSDVWWDSNENGELEASEKKAEGIKLELYSPDHDITIHDQIIPANTLIHSTTTDESGEYELKSYMLDEGQWIKVIMPDDQTKLTLKADDEDMLKPKNSDFDRTSYITKGLPELVRDRPLDTIGLGLIHIPELKADTVKIHVGEESGEGAAKAVAKSDHPTEKPVPEYIALADGIADVSDSGKVTAKLTGKIKGEVTTKNTLADTEQAIPEDTVKTEYDIIVFSKVKYDKNHASVTGNAPVDNNEYYPSVTADGSDANTDEVSVLGQGTMARAGYKFKGWSTKADWTSQDEGTVAIYAEGDKFKTTSLNEDTTLYAIWSLIWTPMEIPTRDVQVTKTWELLGENARPVDEIKVELYRDGVTTNKILALNESNNWTAVFDKLPVSATLGGKNYEYTVKEIGENGEAIKLADKWFTVIYGGTMKDGFTVTNKEKLPWSPMIPPTRDIKVTKEWKDAVGNTTEAPVDKIEVELYKDGNATGQLLAISAENGWTGEFKELEVANGYGSTDYYQYTVKEIGEDEKAIKITDKWFTVTYGGTMKDGFTVTNKEKLTWEPMVPPTRDIKVTKEWKDAVG
ncbi:MAG: Cna B-type domain-containing protein, partial [Eubacteriales bacterium]|nr:Cna B-type domain-containing protein [Eubacteriales bacterium]